MLVNLLVFCLTDRKHSDSFAKSRKLAPSAGTDVSVGEYISATPDDSDVCEVEWDSPRPLSGIGCFLSLSMVVS